MTDEAATDGFRGLLTQIREDLATNHGDWTEPGFRALAVQRFGAWARVHGRRPFRRVLFGIHRAAERYVRNHYGIELPATVRLGRRIQLAHQHGIVVHRATVIGNDCIIRHNVTLGVGALSKLDDAPVIGDRVSLSPGAVVMGGVRIGDDVFIGPNVVVTRNVPAGSTVFPNPPRVMKLAVAPEP